MASPSSLQGSGTTRAPTGRECEAQHLSREAIMCDDQQTIAGLKARVIVKAMETWAVKGGCTSKGKTEKESRMRGFLRQDIIGYQRHADFLGHL